jgi:spermidine synthase
MKLKEKLYQEQTPYQLIEIFETEFFGTLMTLDGLVMLTDLDNFIYHEMLAHPVLLTHPDPKSVLIVGGGDCGTLREVLRHPQVRRADLVEIDERVTRVAEQYFPELCEANGDHRARFHFTDGIKWVGDVDVGSYDVIIIDSTDPIGPAAGLYSQSFYSSCMRALGADGVLAAQSESPLFHLELIKRMHAAMAAAGFRDRGSLHFPQCSYPSGWWTVTLASKAVPVAGFRETAGKTFRTRYYNDAVHRAALALPTFFEQALRSSGS